MTDKAGILHQQPKTDSFALVMDREKVIKAYEDYVNSYVSLTTSHDYEFEMHKAVLALLKEQEERIKKRDESLEKACEEIKWLRGMMKEQETIVRCLYCKRRGTYDCPVYVGGNGTCSEPDDWFCADGERQEGR